jgi:NADH-quinone oxidoreductase subunit L
MIARSSILFAHAPGAMDWVAAIGTATAFMAATIGLAQTDIKKVFAYSTVSQLGYMFMGVGVGAYSAGIFHLMTHAFFKALLFLGAGSVIHALGGEQDLRQMGGLAKKIPITCVVLFCAGVAIAGLPFTSGAASKDLILEAAYQRSPILYWIGVVTAGMTAFYVFRALFLAFFGEYRGHAHDIHEAPFVMWAPLAVLAVLSLGGGFLSVPKWLEPMFPLHEGAVEPLIRYLPFAVGFIGIGIAYWFYVLSPKLPESLASGLGGLYRLILNKYYVDEVYDATVVKPLVAGSRTVLWRGIDAGLIDGIVNGVGQRSRGVGNILRLLQSGNIRNYAAWVVFGSVILLIAIGLSGGWR